MYPILLAAFDNGSYIQMERKFQDIVIKEVYKRNTSWYAFDVSILSKTEVKLDVYAMRCNVYSRIGDLEFSFITVVPEAMTREYIVEKAIALAAKELAREQALAKSMEIARRADSFLNHYT